MSQITTDISSVCRNHNPFLSSFMTNDRVCNKSNTMGATSGAGNAYPSGAPEFTPSFSGVCVTRSLVLCVCFVDRCLSFCLFHLAIVVSVLRFTDYHYPFGIFKFFLKELTVYCRNSRFKKIKTFYIKCCVYRSP